MHRDIPRGKKSGGKLTDHLRATATILRVAASIQDVANMGMRAGVKFIAAGFGQALGGPKPPVRIPDSGPG